MDLGNQNVLVTGGAGFIGSHLCQRLVDQVKQLICVDNFNDYYDPAVKRANLNPLRSHPSFMVYQEDIRHKQGLKAIFDKHRVSLVVHLAAMAGVRPSIANPQLYTEVNLQGTTNLLQLACAQGVEKFIFSSSSSVYGINDKIPFAETDAVDQPVSPYGATKRAGELYCHVYHNLQGLKIACLRFFTVYGPRGRPDMAPYLFTQAIDQGRPIEVFGDGTSQRDYTFISDIIDGIIGAIADDADFEIYNLGDSNPVPLSTLITTIETAVGKQAIINRRPMPPGDVPLTFADISKAQRRLNYQPKVSLAEGISQFVSWYREQD